MDPAENRRSVCSSWDPVESSLSKAEPKVCLQLLISSWKQLIQGRAKGLFAAPDIQLKAAYPRQSQRFVCSSWYPVESSLSKAEPKVCLQLLRSSWKQFSQGRAKALFATPEIQSKQLIQGRAEGLFPLWFKTPEMLKWTLPKTVFPWQWRRFVSCRVFLRSWSWGTGRTTACTCLVVWHHHYRHGVSTCITRCPYSGN